MHKKRINFLEGRKSKLEAKKAELVTRADTSTDITELRSINDQIDNIKSQLSDVIEELDSLKDDSSSGDGSSDDNGSGDGSSRSFNPAASRSFKMNAGAPKQDNDPLDTNEYRTAFMNYVCRNVAIPSELRANTTTTDASAVIPTTILNEITEKMSSYGNVWAKVRKLNVQGGVEIPILSLKPTASWISETAASSDQKIKSDAKVSFSYYGLECKISQTLLCSVTTLSMFQQLFASLAMEAIVIALEIAIFKGTGTGQATGITVDTRVPAANTIQMTEAEFKSWEQWKKKVFAKMKKAYRAGDFFMNQSTFDGYIDGMVDSTGQPIGRVNYGIAESGETYRFGGKTVETVEDDIIVDFDTALNGDVVAVFVNLSDYAVNSNLAMQVVKWTDNDTNEVKNKVIMICDGKLVDPNGVLIIKKKVVSG